MSKKDLEKINQGCENNEIKKAYNNYINLLRSSKETANYIDKTTKQSVILIKDYSKFLLEQDVELISEESIFDDYVLLNLNLNNLKSLKEEDTYVYRVSKNIEEFNLKAQKLGFERGYFSKMNIPDLLSYYTTIYTKDLESKDVKIPLIENSLLYVLNQASNITDLQNIINTLGSVDAYNYYVVINKFAGKENSVITDFREINNRVNASLNLVYEKIKTLEKEIQEDKDYFLETHEFYKLKKNYENQEISFGHYLSELKKINNEIQLNKIEQHKLNLEMEKVLLECEVLILQAKDFSNLYIKERIESYENSKNFIQKKSLCEEIKSLLNEENCVLKVSEFLKSDLEEKNDFELLNLENHKTCIEVLGNINYKLDGVSKIYLLKEYLDTLEENILELKTENKNVNQKFKINEMHEKIKAIKKKDNVDLILDYSKIFKELEELEEKVYELAKNILIEAYPVLFLRDLEVTKLMVDNPFSFILNDVWLPNKVGQMSSQSKMLSITNDYLKIQVLYPKENYFEIDYENKKNIEYDFLYLGLDNSIFKITITNSITGINDYIVIPKELISNTLGVVVENENAYYVTKKINEIVLSGKLFEVKHTKKIDFLKENKVVIVENIELINKLNTDVVGKLNLIEVSENELFIVLIDNKEIPYSLVEDMCVVDLELKKNKTLKLEVQRIKDISEVYLEIQNYVLEISKYKDTKYQNVLKKSNLLLNNLYDMAYKKEYGHQEIKKVYEKASDILIVREEYLQSEIAEDEYFIIEHKLLEKELSAQEENKYLKINEQKYNNIIQAKTELNLLLKQIELRENFEKNKAVEEHKKDVEELKELVNKYNLDMDVEGLIINLGVDRTTQEIQKKLEKKCDEINKEINPLLPSLNKIEIDEVVESVFRLYEEYSLKDMYAVGYFAGISENDAKRLEKNSVFLDGVAFNKEFSKFEEFYLAKEYSRAIDSVSLETVNRLEKIKIDFELIKNGLRLIKNDAKNEILEYQKKEKHTEEILSLAKQDYDEEKYLNSIFVIRSEDGLLKTKNNNPLFISLTIVLIILLIFGYFRFSKPKKKESFKEKKAKVVRR